MIQALQVNQQGGVYEILYYKKNGNAIWLQQEVAPIRSDSSALALLLVTFRDITAFRESLEPMNNMMSNLSKFAKLAWTLTKYRQAGAAAAAAAAAAAEPPSSTSPPRVQTAVTIGSSATASNANGGSSSVNQGSK